MGGINLNKKLWRMPQKGIEAAHEKRESVSR